MDILTRAELITLLCDILFALANNDDLTEIQDRIRAALEAERQPDAGRIEEMPW